MDHIIHLAKTALLKLLFRPESALELWLTVGVGVLVFLFVYGRVSTLMEVGRPGMPTSLFVMLVGLFIHLLAVAVVLHYAGPKLSNLAEQRLPVTIGIAASVILIAPMISAMQKSRYLNSLTNWLAGVGSYLLVAFVISLIFSASGFTKNTMDRELERQQKYQDFQL